MINFKQERSLNEKETIEALEAHGIPVIMKPMALLPDNLEYHQGIGIESRGNIEVDIYEALRRINNRTKVIGDPFSK